MDLEKKIPTDVLKYLEEIAKGMKIITNCKSTVHAKILVILLFKYKNNGAILKDMTKEIADLIGTTVNNVKTSLVDMVKKDILNRIAHAIYERNVDVEITTVRMLDYIIINMRNIDTDSEVKIKIKE